MTRRTPLRKKRRATLHLEKDVIYSDSINYYNFSCLSRIGR